MNRQKQLETVDRFPRSPGVYIMRDAAGAILYIGKAVNLRARVKSYFLDSHDDRPQIPVMLERLATADWIATENETEALILEANLIRRHKPRYNVDLKDDKHYPYLKVTTNETFPRLYVTRRVIKDGAKYFGPYTDARAMRRIMAMAKRIFKIRDCRKHLPLKHPIRPCINYAIGRCSGACGGKITQEAYAANVRLLLRFLRGQSAGVIAELKQRMERAAENLAFEEAAAIRDQIELLKQSPRLQQVDLRAPDADTDVFGVSRGDRHMSLCVLSFREGLLLNRRHFLFQTRSWQVAGDNPEELIIQYYQHSADDPPGEILIPPAIGCNEALLQEWFARETGRSVRVNVPQKGAKVQLVALAEKNAYLYGAQKAPPNAEEDLRDLQSVLHLPRPPEVIEAFDISNLGESFAVAGMVRFVNGAPDKSHYRRYKIKTVAGQNDFAMMMEAVRRRLRRLADEQREFPDLLLIDGGKGQLNAARQALRAFDSPPMIASLAKQEEILHSPYAKEPVRLPESHPARKLVQRIRDEVHRWAITYHRSVRGKQFKRSSLEDLPGMGAKKAAALLKHFGSVAAVKRASEEDIARVSGFGPASARSIKEALS